MPENEDFDDDSQELEAVEETQEEQPDPQAEAMKAMREELAALREEVSKSRKVEPKQEPVAPKAMPRDYDPDMIDQIVQEKLAAALAPVAEQVQANERARVEKYRDSLIAQIDGLEGDTKTKLAALAQRQFESGAAEDMDEAIKNAQAILGVKGTPKGTANQDARRAGRRGDKYRAPTEDADNLSEDDALDAIFAKHNL